MYFSERRSIIIFALMLVMILALAFYNLFYGLSLFPIYSWDEARHGVSAYEMLKKKNFFVNTYLNQTDYWNLKPPLSFWMTIAGYKIAGFNTLGLRIFSAISSNLTIIAVSIFTFKKHGMLASLIAALTLSTSTHFLINHSARTGDADSLFVFLFTAAMLSLLMSSSGTHWLFLSGAFFSLAFLTKSWHAGNIIIIIFFYLFLTGKYKQLSYWEWILLGSCMILPILIWATFRYQYDGLTFFKNMIRYDLLKRSSTTIEGHFGTRFYYLEVLWCFSKFWVLFLLCLLPIYACMKLPLSIKKKEDFHYFIGICLWVFIPLLIYSMAETKIRWYILPLYPPLSIMLGAISGGIMENGKVTLKTAILAFILFCSFHYEGVVLNYLHHPPEKLEVSLVQKLQDLNEVKGCNLFQYRHSNKGKWHQNTVLAAELYGDLHVKRGGLTAFLKNDRGLLLLKKGKVEKRLVETHHLSILASNKWGFIVCKKELARKLR